MQHDRDETIRLLGGTRGDPLLTDTTGVRMEWAMGEGTGATRVPCGYACLACGAWAWDLRSNTSSH